MRQDKDLNVLSVHTCGSNREMCDMMLLNAHRNKQVKVPLLDVTQASVKV